MAAASKPTRRRTASSGDTPATVAMGDGGGVGRGAAIASVAVTVWTVGAGAATVDVVYAGLGVVGAAALIQVRPVGLALGVAGAGVLAWMGVRTLRDAWRIRLGGEADVETITLPASFRTGLVATASNPLTIISWTAIFGAAATASLLGSAGFRDDG